MNTEHKYKLVILERLIAVIFFLLLALFIYL